MPKPNARIGAAIAESVWVVVLSVALAISLYSLYFVARHLGVPRFFALGISTVFDGTALVLAHQSLRQAMAAASSAGPKMWVFLFAGLSAWLNSLHVMFTHGTMLSIPLWASPPIAAVVVFEYKTRWARRRALAGAGYLYPAPLPKFGATSWTLFPFRSLGSMATIVDRRRKAVFDHEIRRLEQPSTTRAVTRPAGPTATATVVASGPAATASASPADTEAEPAAAATDDATEAGAAEAEAHPLSLVSRRCEECGTPFTPTRASQRYCPGTSRCRTAATRRRQREAGSAT